VKSKTVPSGWQIHFIDPRLMQPNPIRKHLEKTDEDFIENTTKDLAHPISIRPLSRKEKPLLAFAGHKLSPKYEVFRGGRRWYAFLTKGLKIPARVIDVNDKDALWKAYEENAYRTNLEPDEEAEHILRLIDTELKDTTEYKECNNDPKKALAVVFATKLGQVPKKMGKIPEQNINRAVNNLRTKLDALFTSLPRTKGLTLDTFYAKKLRVLKLSEPEREKIKAKEVKSSARLEEAVSSIQNGFARKFVVNWISKQKRKVPSRRVEKIARALNQSAELLDQVKDKAKEKKAVQLLLDKGISPQKLKLELESALPKPKETRSPIVDETVAVYCPADSANMSQVKDGSVRLIVTSPPYGGKIAFESDYLSKAKTADEYFSQIEPILQECFRVLMPSGKLVINWADPIGKWGNEEASEGEEYAEHVYVHRWVELAERIGFKLWARQIWQKNVYYSIAQKRVRWEDACRADGKIHLDWEYVFTFRKSGPMPEGNTGLPYEEWVELSKGVWYIQGAQNARGLAVFPEELVSRLVRLYSFEGDVVLDPFLGSGTTVAVAKKLGRRGVGYEINPDLKAEITKRLRTEVQSDDETRQAV
jgi:DNA modification methylase